MIRNYMEKYKQYIEKAKKIYENEPSGHDFSHIERVLNYCFEINKEENADEDVLVVAALFHDLHRVMSSRCGEFIPAEESLEYAKEILAEFCIAEEKLERILYVIGEHDNKAHRHDKPIELQIVQDGDILDALGEVGLCRTLTYCKRNNIPVADKRYKLDCKEYIPDVNPISTCHYIYRTMIPNYNFLHTNKAKEIGRGLTDVLKNFVLENIGK